jgi:GntR family transcriptional regulator
MRWRSSSAWPVRQFARPPACCARRGCSRGTAGAYTYIRRLNTVRKEPAAVDAAWLHKKIGQKLGDKALRNFPALVLLHEMPGLTIDRVLQSITIASADVELSALLQMPLNAPLAVIHRTLYGADDTLLCLYQSFTRGDAFHLKMRLR